MSKTVLVELTEEEAETIFSALIREKSYWEDADPLEVGNSVIDKQKDNCNGIWAKLDNASHVQPEVLITAQDYNRIKDLAIGQFHNLRNDLYVSNKKMEERDSVHISLANAVIGWLNNKGLLRRLPRFDYTDHSSEYEEMEE